MAKNKRTEKENKEAPGSSLSAQQQQTKQAHDVAEKDIEKDPELNSRPERGDDLDEGELARLEGED